MSWLSTEFDNNVLPKYNDTGFIMNLRSTPLLDMVMGNLIPKRSYKGAYLKEGFQYRPTGSVQAIYRGDEAPRPFRRTVSKSLEIETAMIQLETSPVAQREIDMFANTEANQLMVNWIEKHVEMLDREYSRALEEFLFTGQTTSDLISASEFAGFQCFNGEYVSSTSVRGVAGGALESLAPASQINTVHGLAKSVTLGWYNQYADSTGFIGGDSQTKLREVLLKCRRRSTNNTIPTVAFMDGDSFVKFMERNDSKYIIATDTTKLNDTETGNNPMLDSILMDKALKLYGHQSENLIRGAFVGTGANGITMLINPGSVTLINEGASSDIMGKRKGNYKDQAGKAVTGWETPFQPVPGAEVMMSKKRLEFQFYWTNLAANGVVTGTAR